MEMGILFAPAAQDIAGVKPQGAAQPALVDAAGAEKAGASPFEQTLKLLSADPSVPEKENFQEASAEAAQIVGIFPAGVLLEPFVKARGGEEIREPALKEAESAVESLTSKAGDMRRNLNSLRQQAVLAEKGESAVMDKMPAQKAEPQSEPPKAASIAATSPTPGPPQEKSVNARELFGDKLTVVKEQIVQPASADGQKIAPDAAKKAAIASAAAALTVPEKSKHKESKNLAEAKTEPSPNPKAETAVAGKAAPELGEKVADSRFVLPAGGYGERLDTGGQPQRNAAPDKLAAPFALKEPEEGREAAEPDSAAQTAGREAIIAGSQPKESFAQKLNFPEPEINLKDTQELAARLVEQAKLTQSPGVSEMTIRLRPQSLGELTVRIIAENGGVISAAFHSNNSEVRGILQEALPAIRQELSNSGLKVNDVGVYAGLSDFQSFAQNQPGSQPEGKANKIGRLGRLPEEQEQERALEAPGVENQNGAGGVDYRV